MQLEIIVLSKAGGRPVNEDAGGFWSGPGSCFFALSDGVGGYYGGQVASRLVVRKCLEWFRQFPQISKKAVEDSLLISNAALVREQGKNLQLKHMRATAVILAIDTKNGQAFWGHIGDSRLYCFRQGRIIEQTRDHSVSQRMVDAGYLQREKLRCSLNRNELLAALGSEEPIDLEISEKFTPIGGDVFLLCTDGLWQHVEENDMEKTLQTATSIAEWLKTLERQVLSSKQKDQDNYSAIIIRCGNSDAKACAIPNC
jgi:serine/threonine protein phosphatase PrpC